MEKMVLVTGSTDKAIRVGAGTWIARSEIRTLDVREGAAQEVTLKDGMKVKGFPHFIIVTDKAAMRAGW
jgi:hypothetical protein